MQKEEVKDGAAAEEQLHLSNKRKGRGRMARKGMREEGEEEQANMSEYLKTIAEVK